MNRRIAILFALSAAAAATNPMAGLAQERFSVSAPRVAIYNLAGDVRVERGGGSNVVVEITRNGKDRKRLTVQEMDRGGWRTLVVHYPEKSVVYHKLGRWSHSEFGTNADGTFGVGNLDPALGSERITAKAATPPHDNRVRVRGRGRGLEAYADVRVLVPDAKAIAIHQGVGHISVSGIGADLQLDARSGGVVTEHTRGFLRIDTGSGKIEVDDARGDVGLATGSGEIKASELGGGVVRVRTGSGSIGLANVAATEMSVSTGSGSVTASQVIAPALAIETGSGGIHARSVKSSRLDLHTGSGSIRVELESDVDVGRIRTGSGGVTLTIPRSLGADVTLDTGSGSIDVGVPMDLMESRKSFIHGRVGDGRGTLQVSTGSGSVSIR